MQIVEDVATLRAVLSSARRAAGSVGFVPTMGYLHAGHARLMSAARRENELVVVSIFVNPTQFGPSEDFDRYPRDFARDRAVCDEAGVDVLFLPSVSEIYPDGPDGQQVWVEPGKLAAHLDGASRPDHFRGVATVVAKLFNLVQPERAYFGQKDVQQAAIVSRLAHDLAFNISVNTVPTERETDGLALSSRNVYLSAEQRRQAPALFLALRAAENLIAAGERSSHVIEQAMQETIEREAPAGRIEFVKIANAGTLAPVETIDGHVVIALAVHFGATRLIDNLVVRFSDGVPSFS